MSNFVHHVRCFLIAEEGPTATEYAVMLALIILVALASIAVLGSKVEGVFTVTTDGIGSSTGV